MRKTIAFVIAHPDDEAFGPAGTIAKLSKEKEVHIICATGGEMGQNSLSENKEPIGDIRKKELLEASKILGVKKVHFLGFADGTLSNNLYHDLAKKINNIFKKISPELVITFEPLGISGHIDHITVSLATTFVVNKSKNINDLYYYCTLDTSRTKEERDEYFIFSPKGYKREEIDWENDIEDFWEIKLKAMKAHASQTHDAKRIIKRLSSKPKKEYFIKFKG